MVGMLRYYGSLFKDVPEVFRGRTEGHLFWVISFVVPIAVFFNPELKRVTETPEFSRWFVALPIGVSVVYAMLRANYERYCKVTNECATLTAAQATATEWKMLRGQIGRLIDEHHFQAMRCIVPDERAKLSVGDREVQIRRLFEATINVLQNPRLDHSFQARFWTADPGDCQPTREDMECFAGAHERWVRLFRECKARKAMLEKLLSEIPLLR